MVGKPLAMTLERLRRSPSLMKTTSLHFAEFLYHFCYCRMTHNWGGIIGSEAPGADDEIASCEALCADDHHTRRTALKVRAGHLGVHLSRGGTVCMAVGHSDLFMKPLRGSYVRFCAASTIQISPEGFFLTF